MKTSLPVRRARALRRLSLTAIGVCALAPAGASAAVMGTNGAPTPVLHWGSCDSALTDRFPDITDFQCATATVPLDYRNPSGQKIQIALSKLPATGTKQGTLFMNPGGPGARGRGVITLATDNVRQHFDLVGFDPRGTGSTTLPVRCADSAATAESLLDPSFPINPVQEVTALASVQQGAKGCGQRTPAGVLAHMSSANTARDLDLLRKAVGDAKLTYFSFSAGSIIGETYAQLFPTTTRAIALDSPLNPQLYTTGTTTADATVPLDYRMKSYVGTDAALTSFFQACAASPSTCAFVDSTATTAAQLRTKFNATLARIRANNGVVVDAGTPDATTMSYQDVVGAIFDDLEFGIFTSQDIAGMLNAVDLASKSATTRVPNHDLQALLAVLLRNQNKPIDPTVSYNDNFYDAFNAVVCADTNHPTSGSAYQTYGRTADSAVPGFGPYWIYTTAACGYWPVANDVDRYTGPWTARPTTPILMTGNMLGDTSSNYTNEISAAALTGARLVGVKEYGHTTYNLDSTCINTVIDNYLIHLTVPAAGTTCGTDTGPFDPTDEDATTDAVSSAGGFSRAG